MMFHFGEFANSGQLTFRTGSLSHKNEAGERELWAHSINRPIRRAYGISFGTKAFIGLLVLAPGEQDRRRVK